MTDASALAATLLELENVAVALEGDTVTVSRALSTDDAVSLADACQRVAEHGAEVRDVTVAPDHKEVTLTAKPRPGGDP